ncbi:FMN-linked oxidoreductase [Mollisia scopiformis]|uniref:FMN-linked oxidoreductase n=1 Tax=Mollisia scopiformis TaxID=149040 RepID=A0A194XHF7_MOLSC|nr:FMN-linked oxidoreductase [Mollisia scopiformis]KUJ19645.1 FMN-linked oxidoreductase [Mollisia scopiformis]
MTMTSQHPPEIASSSSSPSSPSPSFRIDPPLLNSSNPWATTESDLLALYNCPYTGAVTTRTSLWGSGFKQHASTHQYTFFSSALGHATAEVNVVDHPEGRGGVVEGETTSLNTLGYSPIAFQLYVHTIIRMSRSGLLDLPHNRKHKRKPFIVSVTGTATEIAQCATHLLTVLNDPESIYPYPSAPSSTPDAKASVSDVPKPLEHLELMMEINLSCPNIPDKPPPAYSLAALAEYIAAISVAKGSMPREYERPLHVGIKTPPYTYAGQFQTLIDALESSASLEGGCPISFVTATNTLGSCLVVDRRNEAALGSVGGTGIGGMAGDALHPLALGNVRTIRSMLDASPHFDVRAISIIGIGGVRDAAGFARMRSVGAAAVGVGTALGREGISIFEKITTSE